MRRPLRRLALLALAVALGLGITSRRPALGDPTPATSPARAAWTPAQTRAVMIGVLEWKNPGLGSFPKPGRVDRVLERTFLARGVPAANVTFLEDRAATRAACLQAIAATAAAAAPGETLIVYYAGHGLREKGATYFAPYDADTQATSATALGVTEIGATIRGAWKGGRLLLFADCCHSGSLAEIVAGEEGVRGVAAACLTSSDATSKSTGRWTFTESLVSAFGGNGAADADRDDAVDFGEADAFVHREMRYREAQWVRAAKTSSFPSDLVLGAVDPSRRRPARVEGPRQPLDYGEVAWKGTWWKAQIVGMRAEGLAIHYLGFPASDDEVVAPDRFRPLPPIGYTNGTNVETESDGTWWRSTVVGTDVEFTRVHFDGWSAADDEWVPSSRVRRPR